MTSTKLHAKYSNYRYCIVRECKNTSLNNPGKLWIRLPSETNRRNIWLKLAKRDPDTLSTGTVLNFCEDHFDLENDMENYMRYKIKGSVKKIRMKPNCVPSKFDCQTDRKRQLTPSPEELQGTSKKTAVITGISYKETQSSTSSFCEDLLSKECLPIPSCSSSFRKEFVDKAVQVVQHNTQFRHQAVQVQPLCEHVACQVVQHHADKVTQACVVKRVQFSVNVKDAVSSPVQLIAHQSTATSPTKPSMSGQSTSRRKLIFTEEKYDSDVSYTLSQAGSSMCSSSSKSSKVLWISL